MPRVIKLYSENNDFQYLETLKRNREKRHKAREFLLEGVISINSLRGSNWEYSALVYSTQRGLSDWAKKIIKESSASKHYDLTASLIEKLSDKEETSELLALVKIPADDLERITFTKESVLVVLDRPANPGNLGSSIRTCEALGAAGVIITGHATDLYHPHCVRGSMGALFNLPVVRLASQHELMQWILLQRQSFTELQIIGTSAKADRQLAEFRFSSPSILVFGNETHGLSRAYLELCDQLLKIPLSGLCSSINVSSALAIFLYEATCRRNSKL